MADTKAKAAPAAAKPAPASAKTPVKGSEGRKKRGKPRNFDLGSGVYRFGRSTMYHKKAIYKFIGKKTPKKVSLLIILFSLS